MIQNSIPSISFFSEFNGKEYISFEGTSVELGDCKEFQQTWHVIQIMLDNNNKQVSILVDEKAVMENIPLSPMYRFSPAVSFVGGSGSDVSIDDFIVKINTADEATDNDWHILFNEDFERFIDKERAQLKDSGWVQSMAEIKEKAAESCGEKEDISIERSSNNLSQSLRIEADSEHETVVVKSFRLPLNFPFDVSDKPFEIRYNEDMNRSISPISPRNEKSEAYNKKLMMNDDKIWSVFLRVIPPISGILLLSGTLSLCIGRY
ncbi:MAG: Ntox33 protein [Acidobacteriota bacterium]|nr:Ntox33 protein [Acidobacteriota bacterium]